MKLFNFFWKTTAIDLNRFMSAFTVTASDGGCAEVADDFGIKDLRPIIEVLGGKTFNHGLYRVLSFGQVAEAIVDLEHVFPEYRGQIVPFGFDWLGRYFVCDRNRLQNGQPQILLLEVGMGEALKIDASILDFHNVELVECAEDALAAKFWREWRQQNPADLAFKECVGYKHPPLLGGADVLSNLELTNMSVYIHLCGQTRHQVKNMREAQQINRIVIEE